MKTIKEIVELLRNTEEIEPWMETLKADQRAGVKSALKSWQKRIEKKQSIYNAHLAKKAFDASYAPFEGALVAGVDEAGRGPLAGPVVTATVILPEATPGLVGLDDSKAVSKTDRQRYADEIRKCAISYSIHIQSAMMIDEMNIYRATRHSMEQVVKGLSIHPDFVIADAMTIDVNCPTASIIKADAQSLAVAAASILAKTTRDSLMEELHNEFPMYNFAQNAGYGTPEHVEALHVHGPCEHHRKSFEPVKSMH